MKHGNWALKAVVNVYLHSHRNQTFQSLFPLSSQPGAATALCRDSGACKKRAAREGRRTTDRLFGKRSDRPAGFC